MHYERAPRFRRPRSRMWHRLRCAVQGFAPLRRRRRSYQVEEPHLRVLDDEWMPVRHRARDITPTSARPSPETRFQPLHRIGPLSVRQNCHCQNLAAVNRSLPPEFESSTTAPIATGWGDPVCGRHSPAPFSAHRNRRFASNYRRCSGTLACQL
jgi:hypothetical protein